MRENDHGGTVNDHCVLIQDKAEFSADVVEKGDDVPW
jgi:hypothetical protein